MFTANSNQELTNILHDNLDYLLGKDLMLKINNRMVITIKSGIIFVQMKDVRRYDSVIIVSSLDGLFDFQIEVEIHAVQR